MSTQRYVINSIMCDEEDCFTEQEGHAGQSLRSVKADARMRGWLVGWSGQDKCPEHRGTPTVIEAELRER